MQMVWPGRAHCLLVLLHLAWSDGMLACFSCTKPDPEWVTVLCFAGTMQHIRVSHRSNARQPAVSIEQCNADFLLAQQLDTIVLKGCSAQTPCNVVLAAVIDYGPGQMQLPGAPAL